MRSGTPIRVRTIRGNVEQYNGLTGQITSLSSGLAYVCIGRQTIRFYLDELEAIASPAEGGAK